MDDTIIGVDPGASGGLATIEIYDGRIRTVNAVGMPDTEKDLWEWAHALPCMYSFAVIEKVGGYIGKPQPGSAMFKFGMSYGGLRMALIAAGISFLEVTPQQWQKTLGVSTKKKNETKGKFKNRLKALAQQIFPSVKVTLATADALLLAEYARRLRSGKHT